MNVLTKKIFNFLKSALNKTQIKISKKQKRKEGVDFLIGEKQLYLQSIDLVTTQHIIKIKKQDLGELKDNLFVALVLIIVKNRRLFI